MEGTRTISILIFATLLTAAFASRLYAGDANPVPQPGTVTLDSLSDQYEPVTFDHEMHVMAAEECAQCHHQHGSRVTRSCGDCHTLNSEAFRRTAVHTFMPCKDCHGAYNPETPQMPGLKGAYHRTCFACHRGMGQVGLDPAGCTEMCHATRDRTASK
jgi:hypothetical protein